MTPEPRDAARPTPSVNQRRRRMAAIGVDVFMLVLISANLVLIIIDWLYQIDPLQRLLASQLPTIFAFYRDIIHANFTSIDLAFVSIYLVEFSIQWLVAIAARHYHRWFFYPFIHWYDLLGCIPVGSFRWLRVLRVFSILVRLQQIGWVNLENTYVVKVALKYYNVLVEEISDRIVINVLNGAQREITMGSPVLDRVTREVLQPRKAALLDLITAQLASSIKSAHRAHRGDLETYLAELTDEVLAHSTAGRQLRYLPLAGRLIKQQVQEVGLALVDSLVDDIDKPASREQLNALLDSMLTTAGDKPLTPILQDIIYDIIEQIKAQVLVQQWKRDEEVRDSFKQGDVAALES